MIENHETKNQTQLVCSSLSSSPTRTLFVGGKCSWKFTYVRLTSSDATRDFLISLPLSARMIFDQASADNKTLRFLPLMSTRRKLFLFVLSAGSRLLEKFDWGGISGAATFRLIILRVDLARSPNRLQKCLIMAAGEAQSAAKFGWRDTHRAKFHRSFTVFLDAFINLP